MTDPALVRPGNVLPFPARFSPQPDADAARVDAADGLAEGVGAEDPAALPDDDETGDPDAPADHRDWAWVEEWRAGNEPTPWAWGLAVAAFTALLVAIAIVVLSSGLSANPVVAVVINLLVAAGLVPAIWLSRELPVLRWIGLGAAIGVVGGWVAAVSMLAG